MIPLALKPLNSSLLPAAVALDLVCLGGLWTLEGYQREQANPNSELLALTLPPEAALAVDLPLDQSLPADILVGMGCLWSILEEAHITVLAVHPSYQGQGLGQALLYGLLQAAMQRGLERATLEVRVSNQAALALYHKFGFCKAGRRRRYYTDTGEDGLILWRNSLQTPEFKQGLAQWYQQITDRLARRKWQLQIGI